MRAAGGPGTLPRLLAGLAAALLLGTAVPGLAATPAASPYAEAAAGLAAKGGWAEAEELAAEGLSYDGADSDLLYLWALAALKSRDDAAASLAALEAALLSGRFSMFEAGAARLLRAELLVRTRRFEKALAALDELERAPAAASASFPSRASDALRLRALALYGLGRRPEAVAALQAAARRHPDDPRFARLFFERGEAGAAGSGGPAGAAPSGASKAEADLAAAFLGRLGDRGGKPGLSSLDPELLLLSVPWMAGAEARRDAVAAYRAAGGRGLRSTALALEYGLLSEEAATAEAFAGSEPLSPGFLERLEALVGTEKGRAALSAALRRYSGPFAADRDGDGQREETALYRDGRLASFRLDADQDGRPDRLVSFRDGLPAEALLAGKDYSLRLAYGAYPAVESLRFEALPPDPGVPGRGLPPKDPSRIREYSFAPEAFAFPLLSFLPFPSPLDDGLYLPLPLDPPEPTERAAASAAYLLRVLGPGEEIRVSLDGGTPLRLDRLRDGRLYSSLPFERGLPLVESLDADGDGRFETERGRDAPLPPGARPFLDAEGAYEEGAVSWTRVDADGDGLFEYREELRFPYRKEWDLDSDGLADAAQYALAGGGLVREFSSRLDGEFDERLELDASGSIRSFLRNGARPALVPDKNPRLRWIGSKPFDLGSNLPPEEGVYRYMKQRYRLVYAGPEAFAELLP